MSAQYDLIDIIMLNALGRIVAASAPFTVVYFEIINADADDLIFVL